MYYTTEQKKVAKDIYRITKIIKRGSDKFHDKELLSIEKEQLSLKLYNMISDKQKKILKKQIKKDYCIKHYYFINFLREEMKI